MNQLSHRLPTEQQKSRVVRQVHALAHRSKKELSLHLPHPVTMLSARIMQPSSGAMLALSSSNLFEYTSRSLNLYAGLGRE